MDSEELDGTLLFLCFWKLSRRGRLELGVLIFLSFFWILNFLVELVF